MIDNSKDKGYLVVYLKSTNSGWTLCESKFAQDPEEEPFFVDYENGTVFITNGGDKDIIATYETTPGPIGAKVFDYPSKRLIGCVGGELIYFCRKDADFSAGRYMPEQECLAYYTQGGNITSKRLLPYWGNFNGSEIGGAAAFVALFYNYKFQSIFRDYFIMDDLSFKKKHADYLD